MLTLLGKRQRFCDGASRRSFLKIGGLALGGLSLPGLLRAEQSISGTKSHKSVIMVFLPGGPSHMDVWDLKPDAPVEVRGEFNSIETSVPGIRICEHLPQLAKRMERYSIIRSLVGSEGEHTSEMCFSGYGYRDFLARNQPSMAAFVSKLQGSVRPGVPASFSLVHKTPNGWGNQVRSGYLGSAHTPFHPAAADRENLTLNGITLDRLNDRKQLQNSFDRLKRGVDSSGLMDSVDQYTQQALEVLISNRLAEALDIEREDPEVRQRYGAGSMDPVDDGAPMHNEDFLIARRLVEAGARCVTISYGRWDTHSCRKAGELAYKNNFMQLREYLPELDRCLVTLVDELYERGMENDVSVVVWGEMGRNPRINANGGRDHWPQLSGCILAGGGMKSGQVIGSSDRLAGSAKDRPVHYQEVFATLYRQLGIDVSQVKLPDLNGRPQYLLDHRNLVQELI